MRTKAITPKDLAPSAPKRPEKATSAQAAVLSQAALIKKLIWLYIVLWLIEGGLRRWFLPGLATPLLLIRDPLAMAIYALAAANNLFPINAFITWGGVLGALSVINAMILGHGNLFVAFYGLRCDFIHVPMIFVMGKVLRPKDVIAMAKVAVWVAVPYTMLLVAQFKSPQDAWVNRGVGGSMEGAGFDGALDHFRPPGTFSFISGPQQLYPLFTACWFALLLSRKLPVMTMIASGAAILITIPVSISRTLFLTVAIVAVTGVGAMIVGGRFSMKLFLQFAIGAVIMGAVVSQIPDFQEGLEVFGARWEGATTDQGGFQEAIVDRTIHDLFGSFSDVRASGFGTGFSTNVGQQMATQHVGFGASEAEWGRLLYDNGYILGGAMVIYRVALTGFVAFSAFQAWRRRSTISLLFIAASFMIILNGQWGQTTTLGSSVIGAGLALAAANPEKKMVRKSIKNAQPKS